MNTLDRAISLCDSSYEIKNVRGHYEVYKDGKFLCSADTKREAVEEVEANKKEEKDYEWIVSMLIIDRYDNYSNESIKVKAKTENEAIKKAKNKLAKNGDLIRQTRAKRA